MDELCTMINKGELPFEYYLKMHPFSATNRAVFARALNNIDFFSELYFKSLKSYERLATISSVLSNNLKNLIIITGYRGCGKTNFLHYVKYLCEGGDIHSTLEDTKNDELKRTKNDDIEKEIRERYKEVKEKVYNILQGRLETVEGSGFLTYLQQTLFGDVTYINFDMGAYIKSKPLTGKLFRIIENKIKSALKENKLTAIIDVLERFISNNKELLVDIFDTQEQRFDKFWGDVMWRLSTCNDDQKVINKLIERLQTLSLAHLLFAFFLWELAWMSVYNVRKAKKQLYIFDNIDIICDSEGISFRNTVFGIYKFIHDSRYLFDEISQKGDRASPDEANMCDYYNNTNIIISMRETSAMKITDHINNLARGAMEPFDISDDTNKSSIIRLRLQLADRLIGEGKINNKYFIQKVRNLQSVMLDEVLMKRLFMLNNEDVRTSDELLSKLCEKDISFKAIRAYSPYWKGDLFGKRGIVYKNVFRIFMEEGYFSKLKIVCYDEDKSRRSSYKDFPISQVRVLLVLLYGKKDIQRDRIMFDAADYIELQNFYQQVKAFISLQDFVDLLDNMYSFRDATYWNHLITFDKIARYSPETIKNYLGKPMHKPEKQIYICITPAGKFFLDQMCVHFEYFSQRFCGKEYKGLFEYDAFGNTSDAECVKSIISNVFEAVQKCIRALEQYNRSVMRLLNKDHYNDIRTSEYYYEGQFHEERIILNHIQYLNAYRTFLLHESGKNNIEVNEMIVSYIEGYLKLLYTEDSEKIGYRSVFISQTSQASFNSLSVCIEKIRKSNYQNKEIEITSSYYRQYYKNERCDLFKKRGYPWIQT